MCADYLAAVSGVDEALTRASDFIDLRLKLGSCQRSEIVQHVYAFHRIGPGLLRVPGM